MFKKNQGDNICDISLPGIHQFSIALLKCLLKDSFKCNWNWSSKEELSSLVVHLSFYPALYQPTLSCYLVSIQPFPCMCTTKSAVFSLCWVLCLKIIISSTKCYYYSVMCFFMFTHFHCHTFFTFLTYSCKGIYLYVFSMYFFLFEGIWNVNGVSSIIQYLSHFEIVIFPLLLNHKSMKGNNFIFIYFR